MGQNWSNICCQIKQFCLPLTSILTVGVVSFITKTYLIDYLPPLKKVYSEQTFLVQLQTMIFIIFPFLIFWALLMITCGDPG